MKIAFQLFVALAIFIFASCKSSTDKKLDNTAITTNISTGDTSKMKVVNAVVEGLYLCESSDGLPIAQVVKVNPDLTPPSLKFNTDGSVDIINLNGKQSKEKFTVKGNNITIKDENYVVKNNTITYGNPPRSVVYKKQ